MIYTFPGVRRRASDSPMFKHVQNIASNTNISFQNGFDNYSFYEENIDNSYDRSIEEDKEYAMLTAFLNDREIEIIVLIEGQDSTTGVILIFNFRSNKLKHNF
jgi:hypothetical protein